MAFTRPCCAHGNCIRPSTTTKKTTTTCPIIIPMNSASRSVRLERRLMTKTNWTRSPRQVRITIPQMNPIKGPRMLLPRPMRQRQHLKTLLPRPPMRQRQHLKTLLPRPVRQPQQPKTLLPPLKGQYPRTFLPQIMRRRLKLFLLLPLLRHYQSIPYPARLSLRPHLQYQIKLSML
jgi:hypothetical protein